MSQRTANHPRRAGFTLLEVVVVLGMIALLAGIISSLNLESIMKDQGAKPAYEVFREATHEARLQAINQSQVLYLSYDEEASKFRLSSINDFAKATEDESALPVVNRYGYFEDEEAEEGISANGDFRKEFEVFDDELMVEFRGIKAGDDGLSNDSHEYTTDPLPYLVFHPSGVSSPAVAILHFHDGELTLTLDSFSNGPQLSLNEGVGL